jgi:peptidoglycan/LPS O-acetylase OafA/YrhL
MYPPSTFTWGLTFVDLLAACVLVMALEYGSVAFRILNLRALRWLGRISYGAYVFHDILHPVFRQLTSHLPQGKPTLFATATIALCFTLAAAWASYRWFETPFIRLKDRWTRQAETKSLTPIDADEYRSIHRHDRNCHVRIGNIGDDRC